MFLQCFLYVNFVRQESKDTYTTASARDLNSRTESLCSPERAPVHRQT